MKLLVFAHVPPPHHGQSYMVKLMLDGFGGDCRTWTEHCSNSFGIECYHVNARFSRGLEDIGEFQSIKLARLIFHCLEAVWCRFRYGVENFYYVPAPGKPVALYRDWLVMLICRPFFKRIIFHWHAAGLAKWIETTRGIRARALTYRLSKPVNLSIVLSKYNFADAEKLLSKRVCLVNNGVPDPCPDFAEKILPRRRARFLARKKILAGETLTDADRARTGDDPETINVLFLAHCTWQKGLFAAMEAVVTANRDLAARHLPLRMKLTAAGNFVSSDEKAEFDRLLQQVDFAQAVSHLGFISGEKKQRTLGEADLFCFPTRYLGENQPVNVIEAMAFGLPTVATRWRSLPEMFPPDYPGIVLSQSPREIAAALFILAAQRTGEQLRQNFLQHFTVDCYLKNLARTIHGVE